MAIFNPLNVQESAPILVTESAQPKVPDPTDTIAFNPLDSLSTTEAFKSESRIQNMAVGECAKCKSPMAKAELTDGSPMYFCEKCRVVSPMPDQSVSQ